MSPVPEEQRDRPNCDNADIEDTDYPDVVINADSSEDDDDEEEEGGYMGYQALSMNNDNDSESEGESGSEEGAVDEEAAGQQTTNIHVPEGVIQQVRQFQEGSTLPSYMQVPEAPRPDKNDLLWNQSAETDISMETGHEEKIRSVMSGFKLPSCNIPDWAKALTDDQWQAQVVSKLKGTSQETGSKKSDKDTAVTGSKSDSCDKTEQNIPLNSGTSTPETILHSPD